MTRSRDVADTQDNLGGAVAPVIAGKNRVINGAMDFWQRNTTFGPTSSTGIFTADRWYATLTANTFTLSQETSIVPLGFEYSLKATAGTGGSGMWFYQFIESQNCQDLAGKTVTLSAYCATSNSSTLDFIVYYNNTFNATPFTSGWTAITSAVVPTTATMPTTPQSRQFALPSTVKSLFVQIRNSGNVAAGVTLCFTGVQLEAGNVATPFARAGGSIGGELALCQRYFYASSVSNIWGGDTTNNGTYYTTIPYKVTMRATPTLLFATLGSRNFASGAPSSSDPRTNESWVGNVANATGNSSYYQFSYTASAEI
jgi:hypothetical protein